MKAAFLSMAVGLVLCLCSCAGSPSDRGLYDKACVAARAHPQFPAGATILPPSDAKVFVGKSAACVHLLYEPVAGGQRGGFVVWLNYMAHDWTVDRCVPVQSDPGKPAPFALPAPVPASR